MICHSKKYFNGKMGFIQSLSDEEISRSFPREETKLAKLKNTDE